jgi:hypothetical protein
LAVENQAFDAVSLLKGVHDLRNVLYRHATVKKVVRLDEDGNARLTLIEAARRADARFDLGEPSLKELDLEGLVHRLGTLGRA